MKLWYHGSRSGCLTPRATPRRRNTTTEHSRVHMKDWPSLHTQRLVLRRFKREDASVVRILAGDKSVASTTAKVPHPYEEGVAEAWIDTHDGAYREGRSLILAITLPALD